jgi:beta-glucosidase
MTPNCLNFNNLTPEINSSVTKLLSTMTLEEKVGQMTQIHIHDGNYEEMIDRIRKGQVGSVLSVYGVENINNFQKIAIEESRLGIPIIFGNDVIHGYRTIFPIPIAEACTWDPELVEEAARIAAEEASANGVNWTFAPMVDICRDPRWGRIAEGSGEDPYIGSVMARARVRGFQSKNLQSGRKMVACPKHYVAYGWAEAGKDYNSTDLSERTLRDVILPPFKDAFNEGAGTTMSAFNDLNGVPTSGNAFTLRQILRDEWDFKGFVVSDWNSIGELMQHGFAEDLKEAGKKAVLAGVDVDMTSDAYHIYLVDLVREGAVPEDIINESVKRILQIKVQLGLFENPLTDQNLSLNSVLKPEYLSRALEITQKSMVLLKNEGDHLPLSPNQKICLIGPLVDDHHEILGTWHRIGKDKDAESVLDGMKTVFPNENLMVVKGCDLLGGEEEEIDAAVSAAKAADVVVMVLGEGEFMSGEAHSRAYLGLPGRQQELLEKVHSSGTPVIVVLMSGRPLVIPWMADHVAAILAAWHGGLRTGRAVAEILIGNVNPSGKLTATWPRTEGQIPIYYNYKNTGRPATGPGTKQFEEPFYSNYLDEFITPQYPFGFGLSYSRFHYSNLKVVTPKINKNGILTVTAEITNTGTVTGDEIIQLYVRDLVGEVTRPVMELKGFKIISLKPKEKRTIRFDIPAHDLGFHGLTLNYIVEQG